MRISDWSSDVCSSDLPRAHIYHYANYEIAALRRLTAEHRVGEAAMDQLQRERRFVDLFRSEEHTSELQSLMRISYAVFCLKKKKYIAYINTAKQHELIQIRINNQTCT